MVFSSQWITLDIIRDSSIYLQYRVKRNDKNANFIGINLPGTYRGPFGWLKLPYKWLESPLPETTAISSSSCPGELLFADTSRVDEVPAVLCDSLRPRRDSTSRLAVDITMLTAKKKDLQKC